MISSFLADCAAHSEEPVLITGSVSGIYKDFATETAGHLENEVPGKHLGGLNSWLAKAGENTFIAAVAIYSLEKLLSAAT